MGKVAKIVVIELATRIVVDEDATDEQMANEAKRNFIAKLKSNEILDNLVEIRDDEEMPYSEEDDYGELANLNNYMELPLLGDDE